MSTKRTTRISGATCGSLIAGLALLGSATSALADCQYERPNLRMRMPSDISKYTTMTQPSSAGAVVQPKVLSNSDLARQATLDPRVTLQNSPTVRAAPSSDVLNKQYTSGSVAGPVVKTRPGNMDQYVAPMPASVAAAWHPLNNQLEVFSIDSTGTLKGVWKQNNGYWEPSFSISGKGLAPAGAPLAAVWQPLNAQLEVFTIGFDGSLKDAWKANNSRWFAPISLTAPNFASPCAHVAAVFQPVNNQLEVFAIDANGALKLAWKAQNRAWQGPIALTPPGIAPAGAPLTAVWQPLNEQLEVFWIDNAGAMRGVWKHHNGPWQPPFYLTAGGFAAPGARVTAVWQPLNEQLEVFTINQQGDIVGVWKAHNSAWKAPFVVFGASGLIRPGSPLTSIWDPQNERLHVITVSTRGELIHGYKEHNKAWIPGARGWPDALVKKDFAMPGTPLAAVLQPFNNQVEVFALDFTKTARVAWTNNSGYGMGRIWTSAAITRPNFGPIYGAHAAACMRILRAWSKGDENNDSGVTHCTDFMGITDHCKRKDAFVTVGYTPSTTFPRFMQCTSYSHPDTIVEQAEHIIRGIEQGLSDAMVAAAPFFGPAVQGVACVNGVVFACATLAVDLANRAGVIPSEVKDAVELVNQAQECANGDIVSCAKLGAAGAKKIAGVNIPGEEAGQAALLGQKCASGDDFGACLRLGEKAAAAAGVPVAQINQAARNAEQCYDGDVDACIALGQQAAKAGIPIGGVADGANNLRQCTLGSITDCQELGQALADVPR